MIGFNNYFVSYMLEIEIKINKNIKETTKKKKYKVNKKVIQLVPTSTNTKQKKHFHLALSQIIS